MKHLREFMSEGCAAAAAVLWFLSARIRLKKPKRIRSGLESGLDDPRAILIMVYMQSRWSAWAAVAAGLAAVFAIADGLLPGTQRECPIVRSALRSSSAVRFVSFAYGEQASVPHRERISGVFDRTLSVPRRKPRGTIARRRRIVAAAT